MNTFLSRHRKSAGFVHSGTMGMLLTAYIVAAVLNLVLGNWKIATAMLVPLAGLFLWTQWMQRWCRCKTGDQVEVMLGPHAGMQGTVVGVGEDGASFTVKPSSAEPAEPVKVLAYHLTKVRRAAPTDQS